MRSSEDDTVCAEVWQCVREGVRVQRVESFSSSWTLSFESQESECLMKLMSHCYRSIILSHAPVVLWSLFSMGQCKF